MIAIIDFGAGNLKSISNALAYLKSDYKLTSKKEDIQRADKIILPGVGNFGDAMSQLEKSGLTEAIKDAISQKKPFLGICLGMQLLFEGSEESPGIKGLGILKGNVHRIVKKVLIDEPLSVEEVSKRPNLKGLKIRKVPQIGWNNLNIKNGKLFKGIKNGSYVYFVHSYYAEPTDKAIITAKTGYGIEFASAVEKENVFAVQFHPERSGDTGIKILENFLKC